MIQPHFDKLLAWASPNVDEIVKAKQEYFAATGGEVHEDDRCFEARMQAFFNWYLFDRPQGSPAQTPVARFLQEEGPRLSAEEKAVFLGFTQSRLSLFEFRGARGFFWRVKSGQVRVRDVATGEEFRVTERRHMHGLEVGDLFEARLVPVDGEMHFSNSFTFHQRLVRKQILKEARRRRKQGALDGRNFVWELERMALLSERFKNVSLEAIYNFQTPFLQRRPTAA